MCGPVILYSSSVKLGYLKDGCSSILRFVTSMSENAGTYNSHDTTQLCFFIGPLLPGKYFDVLSDLPFTKDYLNNKNENVECQLTHADFFTYSG